MGSYVKQFVLYPLIFTVQLHGTCCTIEARAQRGREAEKKIGGEDVNKKKKKRI